MRFELNLLLGASCSRKIYFIGWSSHVIMSFGYHRRTVASQCGSVDARASPELGDVTPCVTDITPTLHVEHLNVKPCVVRNGPLSQDSPLGNDSTFSKDMYIASSAARPGQTQDSGHYNGNHCGITR